MSRLLLALTAAVLVTPSAACPFARLVPGGSAKRHLLQPYFAPDLITDPTGSMIDTSSLQPDTRGVTNQTAPGKVQTFSALASALGEDVCYWSMQQLPAPPNPGADGPYTITNSDFDAITFLGDQATSRFQALVTPTGPAAWAGCSIGYNMVQKACLIGNITGPLCDGRFNNSNVAWPLASVIMRYSANNTQAADDIMYTWRTSQGGHLPAMQSVQVQNGWGYGGAVVAKVVPCAQLPQDLFAPGGMSPGCDFNMTRMVARVNQWKAACNVYGDAYYSLRSGAQPCLPTRTPAPPPPPAPPPSPVLYQPSPSGAATVKFSAVLCVLVALLSAMVL